MKNLALTINDRRLKRSEHNKRMNFATTLRVGRYVLNGVNMKSCYMLTFAIAITLSSTNAQAYNLNESSLPPLHEKPLVPDSSRFKLIQSHITAKYTFKLDKYAGRVFQLVKKEDGKK